MTRAGADLGRLLLLASGYFLFAKLGLSLAFVHASATAVWPPTGIALAALLVLGFDVWPGIFAGAFAANAITAGSLATSLGIAAGNTLEGLVGALLVTRFARGREAFNRARDVFAFALLAALLSTTVSATLGVGSLSLGGYADWHRFGEIWLTWWLGDVAGAMIVAPLLILWAAKRRARVHRARALEAAILFAGLVLVAGAVFGGLLAPRLTSAPLAFLCIPFLVWAAFRFGRRASATAVVLLGAIANWGTLHGFGPFVRADENTSLLLLQAFLGTMALLSLAFAALVEQQAQAEEGLARLAAIVESSDDAILTKTLDGVITAWNPGAERLYGYAAAEVIGRPVAILVPPEGGDELRRIVDRLRRGERVEPYETTRLRRDGTRLLVSVTVSPVRDGAGRVVGASTIARDITRRKEAEAIARDRDRLRDVTALAAAAAHEINNPLAVVVGQAQLLAETLPAARERLTAILDAAGRIHAIVGHMTHVVRLEFTREPPPLPEMLDLRKSSDKTRPS